MLNHDQDEDSGGWQDANIPIEYPDEERPRKHKQVIAISFALIIGIAVRVVPFPQTETRSDGTRVVDVWASFSHYAIGKDAISRTLKFSDGKIERGPLKMGLRHGSWRRIESGKTVYELYVLGELR